MKNDNIEFTLPRVNISNHRIAANSFDAWGPRAIPDTELVFIHAGTFALELEGETVQAKENELLAIFPGERHTLQCLESPGTISCIHCDLPEPEGRALARIRTSTDPELADGFRRCAEAFLHPAPLRSELLRAILSEILIRIHSLGTLVETNPPSARVQEMVRYIREHLDEPVTRSTLAREFHASPQHINYLFKTELGTSPTRLLHSERAKKAFLLIQNERISVKEAAFRTGFFDPYHFSKVFKKVYGFPPGRIRRFFTPQG
ncbi:MAG: AraC family transcriptional regulator [Verrucomicrobiota bacterium]